MTVWVDGDSCPKPVRDLLIKAAERRKLHMVFVADRKLPLPPSAFIDFQVVESGTDRADSIVVDNAAAGDLVITRDIPLAAKVVDSGITAIDDRGFVFTDDNIGERLSMRNLMYDLREGGIQAERARPAGPRDLKTFADAFDREVTRLLKSDA